MQIRMLPQRLRGSAVCEHTLFRLQSASVTSRTHVKDYRPRPNTTLPRRPFIPPRKKDAFLTHPTPIVDPFETSFTPLKRYEPVQEYFDGEGDKQQSGDATQSQGQVDADDDETFRNVWPYKKWLWRSDKNFEGRSFAPNQTLEWFIDEENTTVGRAWYTNELRYKSNEDLWRLWYVLLRERNMLNTMRFACRTSKRTMPNYGRLKKVKKSMGRIQNVWWDRANLKLANLQQEQRRKQEKARIDAIEYRRAKLLEKREQIKGVFFEYVDKVSKSGQETQHLFPEFIKLRKKSLNRKYIIDEAMKPKPSLASSEAVSIPADLLTIIQRGIDKNLALAV